MGNKGASSKKSGAGSKSVPTQERASNVKFAEELEATAERYLRQAKAIEDDAAERQANLDSSGMSPNSKRYKAVESDIDERIERAKKIRKDVKDLYNQAADLRK